MEVVMSDRNERNRHGRFGQEWNEDRWGSRSRADEERGGRGERQYSSDYDETLGSEWARGREPSYDQGGYGSYGRGGFGGDPNYGRGSAGGDANYGRGGFGESQRGRGYYGGGNAGMYGGGSSGGYAGGYGGGNYRGSTGTDYGTGGQGYGRERGFGGGRDQGYRGRDLRSAGANASSFAGGYSFGEEVRSGSFGGTAGIRQGGYAGRGPKGYTRTDDRIREEVCERLSRDDDVDASEIEVRVQNGEVTLEGTVQTRSMKHQAEDLADDVTGVSDVHNHLRVMKTLLTEIKDKVTGKDDDAHYANTGTKNTPASTMAGHNGTL
jgi:osmotically-inducible protein OsmY